MTLKWFLVMVSVVMLMHLVLALLGIGLVIFSFVWWLKVIVVGIAGGAIANLITER